MNQAHTSKKSSRKRQASDISQQADTLKPQQVDTLKPDKKIKGSNKSSSNAVSSIKSSSSISASATPSESSLPDGTRFPVYAALSKLLKECFNPSSAKEGSSSPVFTTIPTWIQWCNQANKILTDENTSNTNERQHVFNTLSSLFECEASEVNEGSAAEQESSEISTVPSIEDVIGLIDEARESWTKLINALPVPANCNKE